jgi:general stress protein CsbA
MSSILGYIRNMMADGNGNPSSKRWVAVVATILIVIGYIANLFWDYTIEEFIFNGVMYIVIGALGITGAEKFAPKKPTDNPEE